MSRTLPHRNFHDCIRQTKQKPFSLRTVVSFTYFSTTTTSATPGKMHLLFWKKKQPDESWVDEFLHQSVLWCLVVVLVAASSAALGLSVNPHTKDPVEVNTTKFTATITTPDESLERLAGIVRTIEGQINITQGTPMTIEANITATETEPPHTDQGFYTLLSQILLQLLSSYCTLVPVLRDIKLNGRKDGKIKVNQKVFFVNIAVSILLAIVAPFTYLFIQERGTSNDVSSTINFISAIAATVTASQLAGGIYEGSQKRHSSV